MRLGPTIVATVAALLACSSIVSAQDTIPYNQRVRFAAPPVALGPSTIELRVVDAQTGAAVPALVCFYSGQEAVTDSQGQIRVSNLKATNTRVVVRASGFAETSLVFFPGKRGRSFATVRLVADAEAPASPNCAGAQRPA